MEKNKEGILVVGSVAFDTVETPKGRVEKALGGSAVYASLAASYFARPRMVGVVGEDFADENWGLLRKHGIDTEGLKRAPGLTFHWKGRYRENFKDRDTIETCLNAFADFDPKVPDAYRRSRLVFLGNIDPVLQSRVLDQVDEPELVGMDTMNFWIHGSSGELKRVLARVDVLFLNDEEAVELSGEHSLPKAARSILALGPRLLVVKRGEYGAVLFGQSEPLFMPALLLDSVVDPTGAGDTFAGAFLASLSGQRTLDRRTLARALMAGTAMAAFSVESFSVDGLLGLEAGRIEERMEILRKMVTF